MAGKEVFKKVVQRVRKRVHAIGSSYTRYWKNELEMKAALNIMARQRANALIKAYIKGEATSKIFTKRPALPMAETRILTEVKAIAFEKYGIKGSALNVLEEMKKRAPKPVPYPPKSWKRYHTKEIKDYGK